MNGGPSRPGVVLVAHGSARSGESAEPVLALAEALRRRGFPEVRTAFWKEEPFLHQALDLARRRTVAVLPVFLAEGYFTRIVVPRELGLREGVSRVGGRTFHLLPPLGAHQSMADLVLDRARAALPSEPEARASLLVVLGHGTPRDPGSADTTAAVVDALRAHGAAARVAPAFIDQEPFLADVLRGAAESRVVVVPFLVAAGFHGGETVPADLARVGGSRVVYAEPVGTHPRMVEVAEGLLAAVAGDQGEDPDAPLARAEAALATVNELDFLQVRIQRIDRDYRLTHVDGGGPSLAALDDLTRLARRASDGAHRPLRTAGNLSAGWSFRASDPRALVEALVALYGPAVAHWTGSGLSTASFRDTASSQTGLYGALTNADAASVQGGIRHVCDGLRCLRTRLWGVEDAVPASAPNGLEVPCPRPCPILLSAVLEAEGGRGVDDPGGLG